MQECVPTFSFDPVWFHIGPVPIRWYALAYVAGLMLGWRYLIALAKRPALWTPRGSKKLSNPAFNETQADDLLFWGALGVIIGGRLGYVVFYGWEYVLTGLRGYMVTPDPLPERLLWIVTGITEGGMAFHGGLIGVALAIYYVARREKLDLLAVGDAAAIVAPIGLFFGRVANFINGELWGRPTDLPWAMRFAGDPTCQLRHPSQLYEAALEGLLIFVVVNVLTWNFRSLSRPGLNTGLFLLIYGLSRAFLETVREPDSHMPEALRGYVTMGMLLSIPMILIGGYLLYRVWKTRPGAASQ